MSEDEPQPDPAPQPAVNVDEPPAYEPDHQLIVPTLKHSEIDLSRPAGDPPSDQSNDDD